jgi:hypothetical protein
MRGTLQKVKEDDAPPYIRGTGITSSAPAPPPGNKQLSCNFGIVKRLPYNKAILSPGPPQKNKIKKKSRKLSKLWFVKLNFLTFCFSFFDSQIATESDARNTNAKPQLRRDPRNTKKEEERAKSAGGGGRHSLGFHRFSSFNPLCSFIHQLNSLHNSP